MTVLRQVRFSVGRNYKSKIRDAWMDGNYNRDGLGQWDSQLQRIRNVFGDEAIKRIKAALYRRSGKTWSVTGGKGTAWGWITIDAPPGRRTWSNRLKADASPAQLPEDYEEYDCGEPGRTTSPEDRAELGRLLGLDGPAHHQGVSIPSSNAHYREYIDRAEGKAPAEIAEAYWD